MQFDVLDETDYYLIPDFLMSLDWIKKKYPEKDKEFRIMEYYYIQGYTIKELSELHNFKEYYIKDIIKKTLLLIKYEMTK